MPMMRSPLEPDIGQLYLPTAYEQKYAWGILLTVMSASFIISSLFGLLILGILIVIICCGPIPMMWSILYRVEFIVDPGNKHQFAVDAKAARNIRRAKAIRSGLLKGCIVSMLIPGVLILLVLLLLNGTTDIGRLRLSPEMVILLYLYAVIGIVNILFLAIRESFPMDPEKHWVEIQKDRLTIPKGKSGRQVVLFNDIRSVIWCEGNNTDRLFVMVLPVEGYRIDFYQDQVRDERAFREAFGDKLKQGDGFQTLIHEVGKIVQEEQKKGG
jgi:hypothetical protein